MNNNKFKLIALGIIIILGQSCNIGQTAKTIESKTTTTDPVSGNNRGISQVKIVDSLPVYAELKITPYTLDSILAEVTIVNEYNEPIWLYKPILPTDSLVEQAFYIYTDQVFTYRRPGLLPGMAPDFTDSNYVPHLLKKSNHKYISGYNVLLPELTAGFIDSNFTVLNAGSKLEFKINLAKQYDFKSKTIDMKKAKTFRVHYGMEFPFIKNGKHIFLLDMNCKNVIPNDPKPAYLAIQCKDISEDVDKRIHEGYILPKH
jgi:hypothetical protein